MTAGNSVQSFFRTALRDDYLAGIVADQIMTVRRRVARPRRRVMIVGRDDIYGTELAGDLSAELTARGAAVDTLAYPSRRVTFPEESAAVAAAAPDAVVLASYTEGPNLIADLARPATRSTRSSDSTACSSRASPSRRSPTTRPAPTA